MKKDIKLFKCLNYIMLCNTESHQKITFGINDGELNKEILLF